MSDENLFHILNALTRMEHKTTGSMTQDEYWATVALAREIQAPQFVTEYFARKAVSADWHFSVKGFALSSAMSHYLQRIIMSLQDRYQIYVACAESLGWEVKSFEEWLNS